MNTSPPKIRGVSLIELMFSMAIGSLILILAASLLGTSSDGYQRISSGVASEREARTMITLLSTDLATAVFHPSEIIEKSTAAWPLDRLGFFTLQPESAQTESGHIGDLCAVNYYVQDLTFNGKTTRCLMRGFHESNDTFAALHHRDTAPLFKPQLNLDEPIAFGIVSFEARPKLHHRSGGWTDWTPNDLAGPDALELKIVVAHPDLIAKLKLPTDWDGDGDHPKLLGDSTQSDRNPNLEVYVTSLRFGNHAKP